MVITHNMSSMNTQFHMSSVSKRLSKSTEKLSSGYRINRAADDAAGLSISEKLRLQIRGLNQASRNAQDGISLIQVTEGALDEVHSLLQRGRELSVQAANDTNTDTDRAAIQEEINAITKEINHIASSTEFNTMKVFDSSSMSGSTNIKASTSPVVFTSLPADFIKDELPNIPASAGITAANLNNLTKTLIEEYIPSALKGITDNFSNITPSAIQGGGKLVMGLSYEYHPNSNALASMTSDGTAFMLTVNLAYTRQDYTDSNKLVSNNGIALQEVIAHELMHGVMFDNLSRGMTIDRFPQWFIEGTADTVAGLGHSRFITAAHQYVNGVDYTDDKKREWLGKLGTTSYSNYEQGYYASMYLGYSISKAQGNDAITSDNIADGLNMLFGKIKEGYSLGQSISILTKDHFKDIKDFEDKIDNDESFQFFNDFGSALYDGNGNYGRGSLIANNLSDSSNMTVNSYPTDNGPYFTTSTTELFPTNMITDSVFNGGGGTTSGTDRNGAKPSDAKDKWGHTSGTSNASVADNITLQVGALEGHSITLDAFELSDTALGLVGIDVTNHENASQAITSYDQAILAVSDMRSYYGAIQNRLEYTITNLDNTAENIQAAESRIRDIDIAKEMVEFSKDNILIQAAQSMLSQANHQGDSVLSLLQ